VKTTPPEVARLAVLAAHASAMYELECTKCIMETTATNLPFSCFSCEKRFKNVWGIRQLYTQCSGNIEQCIICLSCLLTVVMIAIQDHCDWIAKVGTPSVTFANLMTGGDPKAVGDLFKAGEPFRK
jgi:hypothetical protein